MQQVFSKRSLSSICIKKLPARRIREFYRYYLTHNTMQITEFLLLRELLHAIRYPIYVSAHERFEA